MMSASRRKTTPLVATVVVVLALVYLLSPSASPPPSSCSADDDDGFLLQNHDYFPASSSSSSPLYSSHFCTGGETSTHHHLDGFLRRCVFRNVLWRRRAKTLVYYADPALPQLPEFPPGGIGGELAVSVRVEVGPRPEGYATTASSSSSVCHVFAHECDLGIKVGHDFDSVWNAFNAMLSLRMLSPANVLVVSGMIHRSGEYPALSKMWRTLTAAPTMRVQHFPNQLVACAVVANRHRNEVTFPTFTSAYLPQLYLQRARRLLHLPAAAVTVSDAAAAASPPLIVLRYKEHGKHGFVPHEEILSMLRRTFPRCRVQELVATRDSPLEDELKLIGQATVYITPGGGGSFTGIFLPTGATAIYGNVCWKGNHVSQRDHDESFGLELIRTSGMYAYCIRQDNFVWTLFSHYEKRYVSALRAADITSPANYTRKPYNRILRHAFTPDERDLVSFVNEALVRAGFHRGYTSPSSSSNYYGNGTVIWTKEQQTYTQF